MPLTALDPNTALIAIDLQKGLVNGSYTFRNVFPRVGDGVYKGNHFAA